MVQSTDIILFWWALIGFGASSLTHIVFLVINKKIAGTIAQLLMAGSFAVLSAAITVRALRIGHLPVTNMFEYLSIFAWSAGLFYFVFVYFFRQHLVGAFIAPVVFMLIVAASLLPKEPNMQLVPALQSYWLQIHVTLAALGEAAFGVAFAANIMFFMKKIFSPRVFGGRLPSYDRLDMVSHKSIIIGYPVFTVGALFAGAVWAEQAWGTFWSWDPKEVCSLIVWLIYTIYFHLRFLRGWRGSRSALLSILGFIAAVLTFFSNMFLGGLHAYT
ncbi:MAG: c-type cytochrome biogenesis protein CcsB [Chitinispirillaceae bacterium]|nr:c-type cytochrome biogenesis protein CcsB [Chitinispirillaceae bacterium]